MLAAFKYYTNQGRHCAAGCKCKGFVWANVCKMYFIIEHIHENIILQWRHAFGSEIQTN